MFFKPIVRWLDSRFAFRLFITMKLIALLLITSIFQVIASVKAQTIQLNVKGESLKNVMRTIQKQKGVSFLFKGDAIANMPITATIHDSSLPETMNTILQGKNLVWELMDNTVVIHVAPTKEQTILRENLSNQKTTTGQVKDEDGKPLPGATIIIKGTTNSTSTDGSGNFQLSNVSTNATLIISSVGYVTKEIQVSGKTNLLVQLASSNYGMDEVIVVGYGKQKKANLTGAVSTVSSKELESRPVQNVGQALQGLVPGLNLQTSGLGGELNQNLSVNIRGGGTIGVGSSASTLVLIDGMEGDLNAINPNDIESISVLKDAASSAIYGSRAPFGVILITTKSGKSGKAVVNYNNNIRLSKPMGLPTMLDSKTFAYYYNEAAANDGEGAKFSQDVLDRIDAYQKGTINTVSVPNASGDWGYYTGSNANTNWFDEFYRKFSTSHEHSLSINGGSEKIKYFTSGNYMDQSGLNRYSDDKFKRYTFANKLNFIVNDHVELTTNTRFVREDYGKAAHMNDLYYHNIARRWPTVPVKDDNGYYSEPSEISQLLNGGRSNEVKDLLYQQVQLLIKPTKDWNINANVNYRIRNTNSHSELLKAYAYKADGEPFPLAVGYNSAGNTAVTEVGVKEEYFSTNIFTDYSLTIADDHQFKFLVGFNSELEKNRSLRGSMTDLISDDIPTLNTATKNPLTSGAYQHWATAGFFGRINYSYRDRYLVEVNGRYDGSSRFPTELRWNLFPSVSMGWNVANESFWKWKDQISAFKLRGSYGELGNQYTNNWYPFYELMPVSTNNGSWLLNGQKTNTANSPGLISSNLTWERVSSWNVGLDVQALRNRLGITLEVFKRNTFNMIGPAPTLPAILGTAVPRVNNSEMYSKGFEIELSWKDRIGEFDYSVRGVLSDDHQVVTKYPNEYGDLAQWYSGRASNQIWGYTTLGIAQSQGEMDAHLAHTKQTFASQWQAGDIMYADLNGDGKVDNGANTLQDHGDLSIIGNSSPRYRFSLDLSMAYKGFDARVFLQGIGKRDYMPNGAYFWGATGGMWQSAGFEENMDFYRDENSTMVQNGILDLNKGAYLPRPYFNTTKNQNIQTRYIQNAAYMRLKNAQIGYTFSQEALKKIGVSKLRVYLSGENLLTFSKMSKVFDPETVGLGGWNDGKTYPFSTVYSFGLNVNF